MVHTMETSFIDAVRKFSEDEKLDSKSPKCLCVWWRVYVCRERESRTWWWWFLDSAGKHVRSRKGLRKTTTRLTNRFNVKLVLAVGVEFWVLCSCGVSWLWGVTASVGFLCILATVGRLDHIFVNEIHVHTQWLILVRSTHPLAWIEQQTAFVSKTIREGLHLPVRVRELP